MLTLLATIVIGSGFEISSSTVDCSGGVLAGPSFQVNGTVGQPDAATQLSSASFELVGGFWSDSGAVAPPCPGDTNGDLVIDVNDLNNIILDWSTDGSANGGDLTGPVPGSPPDGIVDVNDLNAVIVGWGACV